MIISTVITIGQITFILRVIIQIVAHGGIALLGLVILANAPRIGTADTHDALNRVTGAATANISLMKWIFGRIRRRNDPLPTFNLFLAFFLSLFFAVFVAVSDVGFLGLHTCSTPGPPIFDVPASASTDDAARSLVMSHLINGSDPSQITAFRCDAVEPVHFGPNITESKCVQWRNSSYADADFFAGLNLTDTDTLMPRRLGYHDRYKRPIKLNTFYMGPNSQRIQTPTASRGIAVEPHETGVRVVFGLPEMGRQRRVDMEKTMAVEVEVGCMTLGVYAIHQVDAIGSGIDVFDTGSTTGDSWRKYVGPDYLQKALQKAVDDSRAYYRPFFNESTLDSTGTIISNRTTEDLSSAANIHKFFLPSEGIKSSTDRAFEILGNCTQTIFNQVNVAYDNSSLFHTCGYLGLGGSVAKNGTYSEVFTRMICASATQVNMVSATIVTDQNAVVSMNLTRLPSDLHYTRADYYDEIPNYDQKDENNTMIYEFYPYQRYTLSDNPSGPTSHFIVPDQNIGLYDQRGPGSGGNPIKLLGRNVLGQDIGLPDLQYAGLTLLDEGFADIKLNTSIVTRWMGQVGASFVMTSIGYNGWAARKSNQSIKMISTGGRLATCYKPLYGLGFLPLFLAATVVVCWAVLLLIKSLLLGSQDLRQAYGGITPLMRAVAPGAPENDTLLVWEKGPEPRLSLIHKGGTVSGDAPDSALEYLKSGHQYYT